MRQRGNALVFALLGLLVSALAAVSVSRGNQLQGRRDAGNAEATILDHLRDAANNAISGSLGAIQNGNALGRAGVVVAPRLVDGELVWQPTIAQLVAMGYLPTGWSAEASSLNDAPYKVAFRRVPAGCVPVACDVEGQVVIAGPIRSSAGATDGVAIGAILNRIGADSGVSLATSPDTISGFGNTWALGNPVAAHPAGVVGVRIGTRASAFGSFLRIGDARDPALAGDLTVAGNTLFGDGGTRSEFKSTLQVDAQSVEVRDGGGAPCVRLAPDGSIDALCGGAISATGTLQAPRIALTSFVDEGDACSAGQLAMLGGGGLATCQGGHYRATARVASLGGACTRIGQSAADASTGDALMCRGGYYASVSALLSSRVFMRSFAVRHGDVLPVATALPLGCPATAGPTRPVPTLELLPQSDAMVAGDAALVRSAPWTGAGWSISLTDGAGAATASTAIAEVYCVYP